MERLRHTNFYGPVPPVGPESWTVNCKKQIIRGENPEENLTLHNFHNGAKPDSVTIEGNTSLRFAKNPDGQEGFIKATELMRHKHGDPSETTGSHPSGDRGS